MMLCLYIHVLKDIFPLVFLLQRVYYLLQQQNEMKSIRFLLSVFCFLTAWNRSIGRGFALDTSSNDISDADGLFRQQERELKRLLQSSVNSEETAELWTELGLLYQQQTAEERHLYNAVDAFQQAVRQYNNDDGETRENHNNDRTAALYFQLGETYYLLWAMAGDTVTQNDYNQRMQDAWEQSKQLYRSVMHEDDPWISIGYSMVCIRQGVYSVEMNEALQGWELLQEGLVQHLEPALKKLAQSTSSRDELQVLHQQRVTAWHNAATAATVLGQFDVALQALQPVLEYCRTTNDDEDDSSMQYDCAQALYSQADLYLQLGRYEMAKQSYQQAMDYYQQQQGGEASTWSDIWMQQQQEFDSFGGEEWQTSIQMYQDALQEYNELLQESTDPVSSSSQSYGTDRGYVGDLHAALGSLYLSTNELVMAEMHLRQAIRFYTSSSLEGEDNRRFLADVHFNLAQLLVQQGEYAESAEQRILACQLYQETLGEGVNPMLSVEDDGEFAVDATGRMEARAPTKRTTAAVNSNSRPRDAFSIDNDVIAMDTDHMVQWKMNSTFADDEL